MDYQLFASWWPTPTQKTHYFLQKVPQNYHTYILASFDPPKIPLCKQTYLFTCMSRTLKHQLRQIPYWKRGLFFGQKILKHVGFSMPCQLQEIGGLIQGSRDNDSMMSFIIFQIKPYISSGNVALDGVHILLKIPMIFYTCKLVTCEGSPGLIDRFWSLITQSWLKWKIIFKAAFLCWPFHPIGLLGRQDCSLFPSSFILPLDQEAYERKKLPPKPFQWKLWNLLSFQKKKIHRRRCAPITGEAEILGHFGPRQGASERDTKANPPVHCPLPTQYVDLMIFLFRQQLWTFFPARTRLKPCFDFRRTFFFQKKTRLFSMEV